MRIRSNMSFYQLSGSISKCKYLFTASGEIFAFFVRSPFQLPYENKIR